MVKIFDGDCFKSAKNDIRTRLAVLLAEPGVGGVRVRLRPAEPDGPVVNGLAYLRAERRTIREGVMLQFDGELPGEVAVFDRAVLARIEIEHPDGEWRAA